MQTDKAQLSTDELVNLRGHSDWKWYGFPGHCIISSRCAYHLSTRVGKYLISTIGAYKRNPLQDKFDPIGSDPNELFETMVFSCDGEINGDPNVADYSELAGVRYATSREAEVGHYRLCWQYHTES